MKLMSRLFGSIALSACLATAQYTVDQTVLILARSTTEASSAYSGLAGYGIPYQIVVVPQSGINIPTLNSSATHGLYSGLIILSEVSYSYSATNWSSAISPAQYNQLYAYQTAFGVRMVKLDCYPSPQYGATTAIAGAGCCGTAVEQLVSISNSTGFPTANLVNGAGMTTQSLYHYPATITDSTTTWEIAQFAPDSAGTYLGTTTAGVINNFGGREQMVFFTSWATDWAATSNFLQHAYIHWMTRGFFVGSRKLYFNTQIDDVHLSTATYNPGNYTFRLGGNDLAIHVTWMKSINSRLPAGSSYKIELGHNGAGDIENATNIEYNAATDVCNPVDSVYPDDQPDTGLEFQKPLGTGQTFWPSTPTNYTWSLTCAKVDQLLTWLNNPTNRDAFSHISHTFTHLNLDNSTYSDSYKEIQFNQAWLKQVGITAGSFSAKGLIPPAITGMHNGDAIRAFIDLGISNVVGDNSRSALLNTQNPFWPLTSTVAANGYAGLNIVPRWPTAIFYNCDNPTCDLLEWIDTSGGAGTFTDLLTHERSVSSRYLLALRQDPFMFHQANLRASDRPATTIGTQSVNSLLQMWVETVTQEMTRLTKWPLVTKKHDDIAALFIQRQVRDSCSPMLTYQYGSNGTKIIGATVSATGNSCSAPIGITLPGSGSATGTVTKDQLGSEPLIFWATLSGSPVTVTLATPMSVL
ncbi:hypothetical protein LTR78_003850 [Recurvomyces mirabilis]|uniref:Extracellular serine-rich protein n=1 Tax=Recurvomyces mirabilis TaxID=574656 RepID=A0AAE0WQG0_9PEZI|nr:hypothetical protein LTR78_003850 [Recurvomyces mirabilis]KAK5154011.1 hypothetical protein LTS14_007231 [Recurvomyces mirabilis]